MKKILTSILFVTVVMLGFAKAPSAKADEFVNGYFRSNGTYVNSYWRSEPDGDPYNNYSFPGNENPYTGVIASGNPDTYLYNYYNRSSDDYSYPTYDTYDSSDFSSNSDSSDSNTDDTSLSSDSPYGDSGYDAGSDY